MGVNEAEVQMRWGVGIPMRDGVQLSATVYLPADCANPAPAIVMLTPYIGQTYHDRGVYFAAHGYPFAVVDVRGRGNSEGLFQPFINEATDGFDVVEWMASQPYCNGQVAMWGGSYSGYVQWATTKEFPPHLTTIVPVASPCAGVDFPGRHNIPGPYLMQWLTLVAGRTSQDRMFWNNERYWSGKFRQWFELGGGFKQLDEHLLGQRSPAFQEWLSHPELDAYWDAHNPTAQHYAKISHPVLTITGIYDGDQSGALAHYRQHLKHGSDHARAQHHLVIGPWDHAGTRTPAAEFGGLKIGPAGLIDLSKLHLEWYAWTMQGGPKPHFLQKNIAYYVMGAEQWRYANTLEEITARTVPLYLDSKGDPTDVFKSGSLSAAPPHQESDDSVPDCYVHDPRDVSGAQLESTIDPNSRTDQRLIHATVGKQLIYHSAVFEEDASIGGFFELSAWLSIDQADTDFAVAVYEVGIDGGSVQLATDTMRARYREGSRNVQLVRTREPLRYDFAGFNFVARRILRGSRLRLVIGPVNSIYSQKNYNGGGVVAEETMKDAQTVTVKLWHDRSHPSALFVPFGRD